MEHDQSSVTKDDLLEIERNQPRTSDLPTHLPLSDFRIADQVFQWRKFDDELAAEERHVKELVRALIANKQPLEPILVIPLGSQFFVVDGHHRVLAYRRAEWKEPVPVTHFEGSVEDAWLEALRLNVKDKLPMNPSDKLEAAWALVKEGKERFSKKQISEETTVSKATIATMRQLLKEYPQAFNMGWKQARRLTKDTEEEIDRDQWLEAGARKLAKQLVKVIGANPAKRPDVLALALSKVDPVLPSLLVQEWPDEVREFAQELSRGDALEI
jgi:ParB-like chromosome segregation protein Spo0J